MRPFPLRALLLLFLAVTMTSTRHASAAVQVDSFYRQLHSFGFTNRVGKVPAARLMVASDGLIYGSTVVAGVSDRGTLFRIQPDGTGYTVLHRFDGTNGQAPQADLIEGPDGRLYGTTASGGRSSFGTAFRMQRTGAGFEVLHHFGDVTDDGSALRAPLIQASDGLLYGIAAGGGGNTNIAGTAFRMQPDGSAFQVLHTFATIKGGVPEGPLLEDDSGILHGSTFDGGVLGEGTLFLMARDGTGFRTLREFEGPEGRRPDGASLLAANGMIYGVTRFGGQRDLGTVYRMRQNGSEFETLWSFFSAGWDGANPNGGLLQGSDGDIYGVATFGGEKSFGTLFRMNLDGTAYSIIGSFGTSFADGRTPLTSVARLAGGWLLGTTAAGGGLGSGTLYKMSEDGRQYERLWDFADAGGDGQAPLTTVIEGNDGRLYGTTPSGGDFGRGTIFRMRRDGSDYTLLRSFTGQDPEGGDASGIIQGSDGALYGTTSRGGSLDRGILFTLSTNGGSYTILHQFDPALEGSQPTGLLLEASDGLLYGMASRGGTNSNGSIFRLKKDGTEFAVLRHLGGQDGSAPRAGLLEGIDGLLYGAAEGGARGAGTVFRMDKAGSNFVVLRAFHASDGGAPGGPPYQSPAGTLFGTTTNGGLFGNGLVYRLRSDGGGYTLLRSFRGGLDDGAVPAAPLVPGPDGLLYGTCRTGGAFGQGTLFRIDADGLNYAVLHHFSAATTDGSGPGVGLFKGRDGAIYGSTVAGGILGFGTVFRLGPLEEFLTITPAAGGVVRVTFSGIPDRTYELQRSTDCQIWTVLSGFTATLPQLSRSFAETNRTPDATVYFRARAVEP